MKKTILYLTALFISNNLFAQLEVKDTLLLAFTNGIFWRSSSELESNDDSYEFDMGGYADFGKYGSIRLGDNDPSTCWAEGADGNGTGEFIILTIPGNTSKLEIKNGFQKSESLYYSNNRPKEVELTLYASYEPAGYVTESHTGFFISNALFKTNIHLKDVMGFQTLETGIRWPDITSELSHDNTFDKDRFVLKIKILDVYKGSKWDDACISDIKIFPEPYYELSNDEHGLVRKLDQQTDTLFYNPDNVYQVVEVSPDMKWVVFIIMPLDIGDSRVETIYKLYSIKKENFIVINDVYQMYGFSSQEGKLYLDGSDNDFNDFSICLDKL